MFAFGDFGVTSRGARPQRVVLAALVFLLGFMTSSLAASDEALAIQMPWCLAAQPSASVAGYLVIHNNGDRPERLTEVTSPVARKVSIHQSRVADGIATMTSLVGVSIPARTTVTFAPGGFHLMLEDLRRPLNVGERVPVTLWFKIAGKVHASLLVVLRPPISSPPSMRM